MSGSGRAAAYLGAALVLASALAAVELAGWRADVSLLSGTPAALPDASLRPLAESTARAALYLTSYFAAVLLGPVFALAAALEAGARAARRAWRFTR